MSKGNRSLDIIDESFKDKTVDIDRYRVEVQTRVLTALKHGIKFGSTLERSREYLSKRINTKVSLVMLYVDLVNSTIMSNTLPVNKLATIIQTFAQEMTLIVYAYEGYVLKYVGDAVIAYFPTGKNYYLACDTAVECSLAMRNILREGINPILSDRDYPELQIKIGLDAGEHTIIQYDKEIDVIGYPLSMASKISEIAKPDQILISNNVYQPLHPRLKDLFKKVENTRLLYYTDNRGEGYKLYGT